jgi:hypothetical protein
VVRLVKDNVDFESLSEVLKNQTRRRIITCLSDKESISYVDLMNCVAIGNTGKFNYHLKVLGDLLEKDGNGKYRLSQKGQLAMQFLQKFDRAKSEETVFKTRSFSLFSGFIWLLLVYPFLVLMFGWYQYFTDPVFLNQIKQYLLDIAKERGIEIENADKIHPSRLAHQIFSKLIPELRA